MKRYVSASKVSLNEYCDNVGELISVLKNLPADTPIYYIADRGIKRAQVIVQEQSVSNSLGQLSSKLCIDVVDF